MSALWIVAGAPTLLSGLAGMLPQRLRPAARIVLTVPALVLVIAALPSADMLSRVFALLVSSLAVSAIVISTGSYDVRWSAARETSWSTRPTYFLMLGGFWSAMLVVAFAGDFATLWIGITLTTLATTLLVGFGGEDASLEAAWKYLILCSIGISVALAGTLLLARAVAGDGAAAAALSWSAIAARGHTSLPDTARLAVALLAIGYAAKAGIAPMHSWLPDAHSKAPAPVSALLSGVLVSCALYAIMRVETVAGGLGVFPALRPLLLTLGTLSVLVAGALMLAQRDLKRLLAYSTVEHVGIITLALGFGGPLGLFAAVLHIIAHAYAKSLAFFSAHFIATERGTTRLASLTGLWRSGPGGPLFLVAAAALSGMPPLGVFASELLVVAAGILARQWMALALALIGMALGFAALARAVIGMESGPAPRQAPHPLSTLPIVATALVVGALATASILPWTPLGGDLHAMSAALWSAR